MHGANKKKTAAGQSGKVPAAKAEIK